MKLITTLLAATALSASAFSVDFTGLNIGEPVSNDPDSPLSIAAIDPADPSVSSPGNVTFISDDNLSIGDSFGTPGIELSPGDVIFVAFVVGAPVENVQLSFVGDPQASNPSSPVFTLASDAQVGTITLSGLDDVALTGLTFDLDDNKNVPEPSVSILGILGMMTLLRRRR